MVYANARFGAGTITCLRFVPARNMLLAASTDATITLYRVRDWVMLRSLKGHKGKVNSVDAHPQGRVALSVGQDKMLRMWDLVAGKSVATMKVGQEGDVVRWNTDGTKFAVICNNSLTVYGIDMSVHATLSSPSRFHDLRFAYFPLDAADPAQKEYLFVACEDGKTRVYDITNTKGVPPSEEGLSAPPPSLEVAAELVGHANRVKMLDLLEVALPTTPASSTIVLTSISSDGKINLYNLAQLADGPKSESGVAQLSPAGVHDTDGSRLTCVGAVGLVDRKDGGQGGDDGEESSEEEEESEDDEEELGEGEEESEEGSEEGEEEDEDEDEDEDEGEYE